MPEAARESVLSGLAQLVHKILMKKVSDSHNVINVVFVTMEDE
jgi:hypothetical protein